MLETVKSVMNTVGAPTGDFARMVADRSVDLAQRVGDLTVDTAKRIGPKRALIGLATVGVLVGGAIMIMRYLRDRADAESDLDDSDSEGLHADGDMGPRRKLSRAQRKQQRAAHMQH